MIYVGIDVAKDKHDCCILGPEAEMLYPVFTIPNDKVGFNELFSKIEAVTADKGNIKVGLEATGHYSNNLLGALVDKGFPTSVINPLHTNLYRKGLSLRKTKTDKVDARSIAMMLMTDKTLKPYSTASYHNEDLKALTRYRFNKVSERAKLKTSLARLVNILFPELEKLVPDLHMASVYALLEEFPGASFVAEANLTHLKKVLSEASRGRYTREKAVEIRNAARDSIGSVSVPRSLELKHTIRLIRVLSEEIDEAEESIKAIMDELNSPILTIPGIGYRMGAMIIAEIGDFNRFRTPDQILAYAGLSPTTYQSGQLTSSYSHMEKRGSRYLRYALFNATRFVCNWDENFGAYLHRKMDEGKHYNIAVSHAAKKLVRTIFCMVRTGCPYIPA